MGINLSYIAQSEAEGWMAFVVACATPDSNTLTPNEAHRITHLRFKSVILPSNFDNRIYAMLVAIKTEFGAIALVDGAINRIHKDDYQTLFTYCCEVAYSDGFPSVDKQSILKHIGYVLKISLEFFKTCTNYHRIHSMKG